MAGTVLDLFLRRGMELEAGDNLDEAKAAYRAVLQREPTHAAALGGLGRVLYREGARRSARRLFERLVALHPADAAANTNLGILHLESDQPGTARAYLERALALDPSQSIAHYGLSRICAIEGNDEAALYHQRLALDCAPAARAAEAKAARRAPRLLLLASERQLGAVGARAIVGSALSFETLIVERAGVGPLPAHHAIFNTISDADRNGDALAAAIAILDGTSSPVINHPSRVLSTSRQALGRRLAAIEGVVLPKTELFERSDLRDAGLLAARGFRWPLLLRAKGFHSGQHFVRIDEPRGLAGALQALPGDELLAIEYLDAQSVDGNFRKYRVMIVDGRLYPLHLAVAQSWKVHYFSAGMNEQAQWRAEEAAFLSAMDDTIGARAARALRAVAARLELDYAGMDFALDPAGNVLVFEANATMTVPLPPPDSRWDYRRSHVTRILDATRRMLVSRARSGGWR